MQSQFEREAKLGMMVQMILRAAMTEYGYDLMIVAIAAIEKKGRTDKVGVIFDGTSGVDLNPGIRVRDNVRYSTAADAKVAVGAKADKGGLHFSIEYDVLMAHRQVPVLRVDWGRRACQVKGSDASAAKEAVARITEAANKRFVTTGSRADVRPRVKAHLEDLP